MMRSTDMNLRVTDHLANERTFLAYVRTSLSLMAFGFVIAKFAVLAHAMPGGQIGVAPATSMSGHKLGIVFAAIGVVLGAIGSWRFVVVDSELKRDEYHSAPWLAIAVGSATVITGVLVIMNLLRVL
jgi:putative membrane protein